MRLAILSFLFSATAAFAQSPLFPNSVASNDLDFIRKGDADAYVCLRYEGQGNVEMPDKRGGDLFADAYIFRTGFRDGSDVPIWVNRTVGSRNQAQNYVAKVGMAMGQLPSYMRSQLNHVVIHNGNETAFAEDAGRFFVMYTNNIDTRLRNNDLEETIFHESVHATLDLRIASDRGWEQAQRRDPGFITEYAARLPAKEDLAESALFAWTMIHHPGRLPSSVEQRVRSTMPNRLAYLTREFRDRNRFARQSVFCDG